ncbi:VOC family protein [Ponticoccus sp. (in: a-proteobacteria)]|uniref:VOC family protein n=1 Tax=Ponticoccus sp. (in: a-proteobacteria) TaxID=1925025 RepID=UPI003AB469F8
MTPRLRVARPSADLDALLPFYVEGLGLEVLTRFTGHDGFDGLMLGHAKAPWHLEFTRSEHPAPRAPSRDNLLVLYLPDGAEWQAAVARMRAAGFAPVAALNPYWDRQGATFEDPEGWRVVLQNDGWDL